MNPRMLPLSLFVVAFGLSAVACTSGTTTELPVNCPADLWLQTTPLVDTLLVGEFVNLRANAFGCAGTVALATTWLWRSSDTLVARVDSTSGRVQARRSGTATITPRSPIYGNGIAAGITVMP
jgi:hypothetical protein